MLGGRLRQILTGHIWSHCLLIWLIGCPLFLGKAFLGKAAMAQPGFVANYDEGRVPEYRLPAILDQETSQADDFPAAWKVRREEIRHAFANQMYGTAPDSPYQLVCERFESGDSCSGKALRQQFRVTLSTEAGRHTIDLLVFTPKRANKPVPGFLGLSFYGNHTVVPDEQVAITQSWCRASADKGVENHRATADGRGTSQSRWPVEMIIETGMGVATAYCGDIDPDYDDDFRNGVHALFPDHRPSAEQPHRWGTIAAWSWGLSRLLDCLQNDVAEFDGDRVVVIGHSRLGKTALWTAANDVRFAGAISNNSGCGGAALSRRAFGETVGRINHSFPHWFSPNFKQYNLNEDQLPIDQHQLVALLAPRPVYVASASDDRWADPRGEFLSAKLGGEIYGRWGFSGLELDQLPDPDRASVGRVSYHLRQGKHDINAWDWQHYLHFAQQLAAP